MSKRPIAFRSWSRLLMVALGVLLQLSCERIDPVRNSSTLTAESVILTCEGCHTSELYLNRLALDEPPGRSTGRGGGDFLVPLEPYERVMIFADSFSAIDPVHAALGCITCHGGTEPVVAASGGDEDLWLAMAEAHEFQVERDDSGNLLRRRPGESGISRDPSAIPELNCGGSGCHAGVIDQTSSSIHTQLYGEKHRVALRAGFSNWADCPELLKNGFQSDCASCHATCGQCHVSRPRSVGGGLLDSHRFKRVPETDNNCMACHSATIGVEYSGSLAGNRPDVHSDMGFECSTCHHENLHGDGRQDYTSRYEVGASPRCVNCHYLTHNDNLYHTVHWPGPNSSEAGLACTVCHSQPYTNCLNCHAGGVWNSSSPEGYAEFTDFRIGRNQGRLPGHPLSREEWVTVRHAPVIRDGFREWGWPVLEDWAAFETWNHASPHNIRKVTAQTAVARFGYNYSEDDCWINCHPQGLNELANAGRFLWISTLDSMKSSIRGLDDPDDFVRANRHVAVDDSITQNWNRH